MRPFTRASNQSDAERLSELESMLASCTPDQISAAADIAFNGKSAHADAIKPLGDEYLELHMRLDEDNNK